MTRTPGAATAHSPDLAAVLRASPVYAAPGEHVVPVAALATTGLPAPPRARAAFARLALTVGRRALELGVALEAHGPCSAAPPRPPPPPRPPAARGLPPSARAPPAPALRRGVFCSVGGRALAAPAVGPRARGP
ncbi:IucA/IucC family protein [Streptomyces violaceorubidus]